MTEQVRGASKDPHYEESRDTNSDGGRISANNIDGKPVRARKGKQQADIIKSSIIDIGKKYFGYIWQSAIIKRTALYGKPEGYASLANYFNSVAPYDFLPEIEKLVSIGRSNIKKPVIQTKDSDNNGVDISFINDYVQQLYSKHGLLEKLSSSFRDSLINGASFLLFNTYNTGGEVKIELLDIYSVIFDLNKNTELQQDIPRRCSFFLCETIISGDEVRDIFGSSDLVEEALKKGFGSIDTFAQMNFFNYYSKKIADGVKFKLDPSKYLSRIQKMGEVSLSTAKYTRIFKRAIKEHKTTSPTGSETSMQRVVYDCEHYINDVYIDSQEINSPIMPVLPLLVSDSTNSLLEDRFPSMFDYVKNDLMLLAVLRSSMVSSVSNSPNNALFIDPSIMVEASDLEKAIRNGLVLVKNMDGNIAEKVFVSQPATVDGNTLQAIEMVRNSLYEKFALISTNVNANSAEQERLRQEDRTNLNVSLMKCFDIFAQDFGSLICNLVVDIAQNFPSAIFNMNDSDQLSDEQILQIKAIMKPENLIIDTSIADTQTSMNRSLEIFREANAEAGGELTLPASTYMKMRGVDKNLIEKAELAEKTVSEAKAKTLEVEIKEKEAKIELDRAHAQLYMADAMLKESELDKSEKTVKITPQGAKKENESEKQQPNKGK